MKDTLKTQPFIFSQIHIDAARNSTDDFNLFHDKHKWCRIQGNPFAGPIVLGFQLECLIEYQIRCYREQHAEQAVITDQGLRFSNYQFTFTNVVKPEEPVFIDIKKSQYNPDGNRTLSNRVAIRNQQGMVLLGYKKESQAPLFLADCDLTGLPDLRQVADRSYLAAQPYFYKRKYMNTGNAKNFLSGSLVEQSAYFDELEDKACFPETFPVSLISCALLERAFKEQHDFEREPMVYISHSISVDRTLAQALQSNDELHLLVGQPVVVAGDKGLGGSGVTQHFCHCFGLVNSGGVLFRAEIAMTPLEQILKS